MPRPLPTTWLADHPGIDDVEHAARIWAAATATRDGVPGPASWQDKTAGIEARLALPRSVLLFAGVDRARPDSFALLAQGNDRSALELFYLASMPATWGLGYASLLLEAVEDHARSQAVGHLWLWVIEDNERAKTTYERAGWRPTQHLHGRGRPERLYHRDIF